MSSPETLLEKSSAPADFQDKVIVAKEGDFKLLATDRCDRCGAQAYVEVSLTGSVNLLFCVHHYKAQASALLPRPSVLKVRDESQKLFIKPPVTD